MRWPGQGRSHRLLFTSLYPPVPPPPPGVAASFPLPYRKRPFLGAVHWGPCVTQAYQNWSTGGGFGYPPTGSKLCSTHGGAQSEPRGCSNLKPNQFTPLPVNGAATDVSGKRSGKFGPPGAGGGVPVPPTHGVLSLTVRQQRPHVDLNSALWPVHLTLPSLTKGWLCNRCPPLVWSPIYFQAQSMAANPYSPSSAYLSRVRPGLIALWGRPTPSTSSLVGVRRWVHC